MLDVLKDVCKDKLLVIASHNEKLVKEYSTRIMYLYDGVLTCEDKNRSANASKDGAKKFVTGVPEEKKTNATIILENNKIKTKKSRMPLSAGLYAGLNSL